MHSRAFRYALLAALVGLNLFVWIVVFGSSSKELTVSFLNVGQGDAILIESPTGTDVLIDGGRDRSVLRELPKRLGPLDRTLDLVIATHPDADHIGGLPGVFKNYRVLRYMEPGVISDTSPTEALAASVSGEEGIERSTARRGMRLSLGGGAYTDILFPDREVPGLETNTASVIVRVVYGETAFLLSGDAPSGVEDWIVRLDGKKLSSEVLKAGHHGSRTSTGEALLAAVDPAYVVVSAGKDNSYGHPHQEVLDRVYASGATVVSTAVEGTVTFSSNGTTVRKH